MQDRAKLLKEWKKQDPYLEDLEGYEEFVEDRITSTEVATFQSGKELERAFMVIKNVAKKASLRISEEGVFLRETNEEDSVLVTLSIPPSALEELEIEGVGTAVEVNTKDFMNYFKRARGDEPVALKRGAGELIIGFPESSRKFSIKVKEATDRELPDLDFPVEVEVMVPAGELKSTLLDAGAAGKLLLFERQDGTFRVKTVGDLEKDKYAYQDKWKFKEASSKFLKEFEDAQGSGSARSWYNQALLKPLVRAGLGDVTLQWSDEMPLCVSYAFLDGLATLEAKVAPNLKAEAM